MFYTRYYHNITHSSVSFAALTKISSEELSKLNLESLGCDEPKLLDAETGLKEWRDVVSMAQTGLLEKDIKELKDIQALA